MDQLKPPFQPVVTTTDLPFQPRLFVADGAVRIFHVNLHSRPVIRSFFTGGVAYSRTTGVRTEVRVWDFAKRRPHPGLEFASQKEDNNVSQCVIELGTPASIGGVVFALAPEV